MSPAATTYRTAGLVVGVLVCLVTVGCAEEITQIELESVEAPPGGSIATVVKLPANRDQDSLEERVVAVADDHLFVRDGQSNSWEVRMASWPGWVSNPGLGFFHLVHEAGREGDFSAGRFLTYFDEKLWVLARPTAGTPPLLFTSGDAGLSWAEVDLPASLNDRARTVGRERVGRSLHMIADEEEFFLVDGRRIWRYRDEHEGAVETEETDGGEAPEEAKAQESGSREEGRWETIRLEGVELLPVRDDDIRMGEPGLALPRRIRHYLPATQEQPYEFVTLYGAELTVYRRGEGENAFEVVATLDAVDRDLRRSPGGGSLYLLEHHTLYRSDDDGETWTGLTLSDEENSPVMRQSYERMFFHDGLANESGYRIWVSGAAGGLYWSEDRGETWIQGMGRDVDGRSVTGLAFVGDGEQEEIWASTSGRGMWRSRDGGESWVEANESLRAGQMFEGLLLGNGDVLLGTDAGLFIRRRIEEEVDWEVINERAITSMMVRRDEEQIVSGTRGGSVVVQTLEGEERSSEAAPIGRGDLVQFTSPDRNLRGVPSEAVVALRERPGSSNLYAWSSQQGLLVSNDDGESWRRIRLGAAFRGALTGSVITEFLASEEGSFFAVTTPTSPSQPTQLWRSLDGGQTWVAIFSAMDSEMPMPLRLTAIAGESLLVMAHGNRLSISADQGNSWNALGGPWDEGVIAGLRRDEGRVVLVVQLAHSSEVMWVSDLRGGGTVDGRHLLEWPTNWRLVGMSPIGIEVGGDHLLLSTRDAIYQGKIPRRQTSLPWSLAVFTGLVMIFLLSAVGFAYLRRYAL